MIPAARATHPSPGRDDSVVQSLFEPWADSHLAAGAKRLLQTNLSHYEPFSIPSLGKKDLQLLSACLIHVGGSALIEGEAKGFTLPCVMGEFLPLQPSHSTKHKKPGFAHVLNVKCIMTHPHSSFPSQASSSQAPEILIMWWVFCLLQ